MKIKSIKVIDGKNKWSESKDKLIHMVLDLGVYENKPSNKIEGFYERIKEHLPSLQSHRCSEGKPGGFFKRIKEGTWMGHIIEHVALELQTLAGMDTGWGRTRGVKGQKGMYNVVFNYEDKDKGKLAAREAFNVVNDIIDNKNPQIDSIVKKLKPKNLQESIRRILLEETSLQSRVNELINSRGIVVTSTMVGGLDTLSKILNLDLNDVDTQEKLVKNFINFYDLKEESIIIDSLEVRTTVNGEKVIKVNGTVNDDWEDFSSWYVLHICGKMERFFPFKTQPYDHSVFSTRNTKIFIESEFLYEE